MLQLNILHAAAKTQCSQISNKIKKKYIYFKSMRLQGFPGGFSGKEPTRQCT